MAAATSPLPQIIKQLRDVLRATRYTLMVDVEPLVEQAFILLGFENPDDLDTQIHASELAYNIAVMLEHTQDRSMIKLCMGMLMKMGPVGRTLAASYLLKGKLPRESLTALLDALPPQHKLFMANHFFIHPYKGEPWFLRWAHESTRSLQGEDPEEALLFLQAIPWKSEELSFPLQRELLRGRFGVWLHRLLHLELDEEQLGFMVETTRRLRSHYVSLSLSLSLPRAKGEILKMLLRSLGNGGRKRDSALIAKIMPLVRHEDDAVCLAALEALAELKAEKLPQALAYAHARRQELQRKLLPLVLRLDAVSFRVFIQRLPRVEQMSLMPECVALFSMFDSIWLMEALNKVASDLDPEDAQWQSLMRAAREFILAHKPARRSPAYVSAPLQKTGMTRTPLNREEESSAFALFERFKRGVTKAPDTQNRSKGQELAARLKKGGLMEKVVFEGQELSGLEWGGARLLRCTMGTMELSRNILRKVRFEKCVLRNMDLRAVSLHQVEFIDCELTNCCFSSSIFTHVTFTDCVFFASQFPNCVFKELSVENSRFMECDFSGTRFEASLMLAVLLQYTHFAHASFFSSRLQGVDFQDCRFHETFMERCLIRNSGASTSAFSNCGFHALDTDEPSFLRQERATSEQGRIALIGESRPAPLPAALGSAAGIRLLFRLLEQWFFEKDLKEREALFLSNNRRRLDWAMCMLPAPADEFLRMLPAILESGDPDAKSLDLAPACAIHNYAPDFATRRLLEKYGIAPPPKGEERDKALRIDGVYTIGSTGTIAHARSSDIDLWVCYSREQLEPEDVAALQDKLHRIEQWAWSAFDVEVHFFLMDIENVRNNEFGYTDKESAGSSQAQLLKEEFYRTSVYLAGKKPLWWYTPADVDRKGYQNHFKRFLSAVGPMDTSVLDLGHLEDIPKEEFFGASLWQIVKAIKSPFKSAMKLALLDKYTHGETTGVLLCNRIKHNLFLGGKDLWDIDPYALMFREVFEYYRETGNTEAQDLMRLAFLQKTGLYLAAQSTGRFYEMQDYSYMEYFFPYSEAEIASHVEPGRGVPTDEIKVANTYAELVGLGQMMVRFMLTTYSAIQKLWASLDLEKRVTDEDMTKLGRKVFSYLRPRKHKVMRVPFMSASKNLFATLEFSCQGLAGANSVWVVVGEPPKRKGVRSKREEIRRGKELDPILAWLVLNGVYTPNMPILGSSLSYPLALGDLTEALTALHRIFPVPDTFDTDIGEYLRPEQVMRALCLINFSAPREERTITAVTLFYSTNWGEVFCLTKTDHLKLLRDRPLEFLRKNTGLEPHKELVFETRTPPKSLCPDVRLIGI